MKPAFPNHHLGLTARQHKCMQFIVSYIEENNSSPSYAMIMDYMGFASKSGVTRIVRSLLDRGCVHYNPRLYRSLVPTDAYMATHARSEINILVNEMGPDIALKVLRGAEY